MLSNNLPDDLMTEIIARLPVKSLLRFKCVAKSWYVLITNHSFITKQLECSNSFTKNRCLKLISQSHPPHDLPPKISLISKEPYVLRGIELHQIPEEDWESISISSQCNGIFCLYGFSKGHYQNSNGETRLMLWNPGTKEVKVIHPPPSNHEYVHYYRVGFGFDPITKDYKVVKFSKWSWEGEEEEQRVVEVYNLSTHSWRKLDVDIPKNLLAYHSSYDSYLNGVYHWIVLGPNDSPNNEFILSFDFSKEEFGVIHLPPGFPV